MENEQPQLLQKEGIKLTKNTKGYFWEIKMFEFDLEKLEKLDMELRIRFGGVTE